MIFRRKKNRESDIKKGISNIFPFVEYIGNLSPSYINLSDFNSFYKFYTEVPELNAIINNLGRLFSKAKFRLKDLNKGEYLENHKILDLLNYPNPLQSGAELLEQIYISWKIGGGVFMYALMPNGYTLKNYESISALYYLPTQHTSIKFNDNFLKYTKLSNIIKECYFGRQKIDVNRLILLNDSGLNLNDKSFFLGTSKIVGLQKPLTNLISNYDSKNSILRSRGALGILTNDSKDGIGTSIPLDAEEVERVQKEYKKFGLLSYQWQLIITNLSLKYQNIQQPVKDLQLNEFQQRDKIALCDAYNYPILLLNEVEGSTYNNLSESKKLVYEDTIIPDWNKLEYTLNKNFGLHDKNLKLEIDYSHIEVLKENESVKTQVSGEKAKTISDIIEKYNNGALTMNQAKAILTYSYKISEKEVLSLLKK